MPVIDFSEVKGLEPVPEGTYRATVKEAKFGISSNGNPKIDIQFSIEGGEFPGRVVFDNLTFTEASLGIVKAKLQGLGFPNNLTIDTDDEDGMGELCEDMLGRAVSIHVTIQQSNGTNPETGEPYEPRNRVKRIKPASMEAEDLFH
jgi:hypothetical protein